MTNVDVLSDACIQASAAVDTSLQNVEKCTADKALADQLVTEKEQELASAKGDEVGQRMVALDQARQAAKAAKKALKKANRKLEEAGAVLNLRQSALAARTAAQEFVAAVDQAIAASSASSDDVKKAMGKADKAVMKHLEYSIDYCFDDIEDDIADVASEQAGKLISNAKAKWRQHLDALISNSTDDTPSGETPSA